MMIPNEMDAISTNEASQRKMCLKRNLLPNTLQFSSPCCVFEICSI